MELDEADAEELSAVDELEIVLSEETGGAGVMPELSLHAQRQTAASAAAIIERILFFIKNTSC